MLAIVEKPLQGPYTSPPPLGYPTRDAMLGDPKAAAVETKYKGDGFWKGWYIFFFNFLVYDYVDQSIAKYSNN